MKPAPKHPREKERLAALHRLQLLDTLPEKEFDELTLIASQICNTPMALVSLVDDSRQWFKSRLGMDLTETSRDISMCAHVILQNDVLVVNDISKDQRFNENSGGDEVPSFLFYAGAPLLSPDGFPIGTLCVFDTKPHNFSAEQEKALMALSNQLTRLLELRLQAIQLKSDLVKLEYRRTAVESLPEGIVLMNSSFEIVDYNPSALAILGLSAEQLTGKTPINPDWKTIRENGSEFPYQEQPSAFSLRTGQPIRNSILGVRRTEDDVRWLRISSTPMFLQGTKIPSHVVCNFSDITAQRKSEIDRRMMETKMIDSARLSTLGEMAGGIAHEINTPLASILMLTDMLTKRIPDPNADVEDLLKKVMKIQNTSQLIAKIVKGLKFFSRDSGNDPKEHFFVGAVVESTLDFCRERMNLNQVELKIDIEDQLTMYGRSTEISQVLMNLLSNALDAIIECSVKWIEVKAYHKGNKIFLTVTDSGTGIPSVVAEKMMNPFFTTKEVGKGTGLGLSISSGIIAAHAGKIYYDEGKGHTCFVIELPFDKSLTRGQVA